MGISGHFWGNCLSSHTVYIRSSKNSRNSLSLHNNLTISGRMLELPPAFPLFNCLKAFDSCCSISGTISLCLPKDKSIPSNTLYTYSAPWKSAAAISVVYERRWHKVCLLPSLIETDREGRKPFLSDCICLIHCHSFLPPNVSLYADIALVWNHFFLALWITCIASPHICLKLKWSWTCLDLVIWYKKYYDVSARASAHLHVLSLNQSRQQLNVQYTKWSIL